MDHDPVRFFVIVLWGINIVLVGMSAFFYGLSLPTRRRDENMGDKGVLGHIALIGFSYVVFMSLAAVATVSNIEQELTARSWLVLIALITGTYGLIKIMFYERGKAGLDGDT